MFEKLYIHPVIDHNLTVQILFIAIGIDLLSGNGNLQKTITMRIQWH